MRIIDCSSAVCSSDLYLHQLYTRARPVLTGRVTVPLLWDTATDTIDSNESSEIIRMFNRAHDELGARPGDYYPEALSEEIEAVNERVYATVNNGVYRAGFATTTDAKEDAVLPSFENLVWHRSEEHQSELLSLTRISHADISLKKQTK